MSEDTAAQAPAAAPEATEDPNAAAGPDTTPPHLYDAVSTQREHVLNTFDTQRSSILKAVSDQREAALAPIRAVHARQTAQAATPPAGPTGTACRQPLFLTRQNLVVADIVSALRAMIAEEVRAQLNALLSTAAQPSPKEKHTDSVSKI